MTEVPSFSIQREVQLRFLSPEDIPEVKRLCTEWFPIEYPDTWYQEIASNPKFYSLAATYHSHIIGLIVSEIKHKSNLNKEDSDILSPAFSSTVQVAYILSLGVIVDFRKHGIGSLLLDSLLSYLTTKECCDCKATYLHVLSTNQTAIRFYERRNFTAHSFLPYYYSIQGKPRDGYSYVLYINGGKPPWSLLDYMSQCGAILTKLQPCALPRQIMRTVRRCFCRILSSTRTQDNGNSYVS
ncbi:N-alpha-acetyltransferase 60-like [Mya arenaria]|uniref:N-alpha-acetyltransferase 60-like n=1 Tax=Mya arenaria TaxID=6604 RepID=UPI0022DEC1AF|nr:N-alpha-acetyltransferase 60-like [Mya arenaria]XP_052815402.1 N-alpha-acetyltransferase 60-like [Mya arenaria]